MKFSANQRMKKIVEWATGDANYADDMHTHVEADINVVMSIDDLYNIENEIRTAYESGYQEASISMKDLKTVLDFMLEYGRDGSLPNMDEGGSGYMAYEAALRLAESKAPAGKGQGNITEYKLFQDLHQMVSGTDVTYKQVDSDLDEEGDVTVFFSNVKGGGNE